MSPVDFADIRGHTDAIAKLEIAAIEGHNILMIGSPGCGKTMLARRFHTILPPMTAQESLEVETIFSVARLYYEPDDGRPFLAPHHTVSQIAMSGGLRATKCREHVTSTGERIPLPKPWAEHTGYRPGQLALAHNGVLFLDELPEFSRYNMEWVNTAQRDQELWFRNSRYWARVPTRFTLIAAMNPCPCGYLTSEQHECRCSSRQIRFYQERIPKALRDSFKTVIHLRSVKYTDILHGEPGESSAAIRERVIAGRKERAQ